MSKDSVYIYNNGNTRLPTDSEFKEIVHAAQKGSQDALSTLYSLSYDKIFRFIFYRVNHKELAEDITEEVFIKAFRNLKTITKRESFDAWLYQIARNSVIDYYRSKKQTVGLEEIETTFAYEDAVIDTVALEASSKVLLQALTQLPKEQQIVLKLKFFEELSNQEIAELLHKKEGAIRVIQFRALAKLKQLLKNTQLF